MKGRIKTEETVLLDFIEKYGLAKKSILDVGCGYGRILKLLKKNNIRAAGVDANKYSVELLKKQGFDFKHFFTGSISR